jgi:SepF-like predicted cell division protein (DUF552 family)
MKISGQLLTKIIKEEVQKFLEQEEVSKDVEKVSQSISKASGFEQRIKSINTQEELEELLQFVLSELDPMKINSQKAKKALRTIFNKL